MALSVLAEYIPERYARLLQSHLQSQVSLADEALSFGSQKGTKRPLVEIDYFNYSRNRSSNVGGDGSLGGSSGAIKSQQATKKQKSVGMRKMEKAAAQAKKGGQQSITKFFKPVSKK